MVDNTSLLPQPLWHNISGSKIFAQLASDSDSGLTAEQVAELQSKFGFNELVGRKGKPGWLKFILHFNQPLLIILICAGAIKAILGEWLNAGVIWGVTTTNATISYFKRHKPRMRSRLLLAALSPKRP